MTTLTFIEVPVNDLGIVLVCLSNGLIMFERSFTFVPTYDYSKEGVTACFDAEGFCMLEPDGPFVPFEYGTAYPYKEIPIMKKWLVQQNLQPI
jgi:hypothetical protein